MSNNKDSVGTDLLENTTFSQLLSSGPGPLDTPPTILTAEQQVAADTAADKVAADKIAADTAAAELIKTNEGKTPEEIVEAKKVADAKIAEDAATVKAAKELEVEEAKQSAIEAAYTDKEKENVAAGLNADGTKKTTDSDPDSGGTGDDKDPTIIELVQTNLGYDVDGSFDNSVDGVTDYVKQVIPIAARQMVDQIFEEYPEAKSLIDHLAKGNSLETFMEETQVPDYFSMKVDETDENIETQRTIMKLQFDEAGVEDDVANSLISNLEENGKLRPSATAALTKMQNKYKNLLDGKKEQELATQEVNQKAAKKQWGEVKTMVDSGQLGTLKIPASKQGAFWDYLTKPIDNKNTTLRSNKNTALTLEQRMMLEYMVFSEFKIAGSKKVSQDLAALADANSKREARLKGAGAGIHRDDGILDDKKGMESLSGLSFTDLLK